MGAVPSDHAAASVILTSMASAWGCGDAASYAAVFTPTGICIVRDGTALVGREQIEGAHAFVFRTTHKGSTLEECRVLSSSRAGEQLLVEATRTVVRGQKRNVYDVRMALLQDAGEWRVAHFAAYRAAAHFGALRDTLVYATAAVGLVAVGALLALLLRRRS